MYKIVLIRHGESEWNRLNLFTGWTNVELSEKGVEEAKQAGQLLKEKGYDFDLCFTSYLKRAQHTLALVLENMGKTNLPVIKAWELNERHYGALQGLNKSETAQKYGEAQVKIWRRSYDVAPPALETSDKRAPQNDPLYKDIEKNKLPLTESLKITVERVVPYWENMIKPEIIKEKRIIIAAHGNSLRALVKHLDKMSDEAIVDVNIPTGVPLVYEFDNNFNVIKKYYLGNQEALKAKTDAVKNQGKVK